jgi:hypothetical protein
MPETKPDLAALSDNDFTQLIFDLEFEMRASAGRPERRDSAQGSSRLSNDELRALCEAATSEAARRGFIIGLVTPAIEQFANQSANHSFERNRASADREVTTIRELAIQVPNPKVGTETGENKVQRGAHQQATPSETIPAPTEAPKAEAREQDIVAPTGQRTQDSNSAHSANGQSPVPPANTNMLEPSPMSWAEIKIVFLSEERVEICRGGNRETCNYGELGFEDHRNGKPNRAWIMLLEMANRNGAIPRPTAGRHREMIQKRIEEIREKLRAYFKIQADPIPFSGNTYQTSFKIGRRPSFDT